MMKRKPIGKKRDTPRILEHVHRSSAVEYMDKNIFGMGQLKKKKSRFMHY